MVGPSGRRLPDVTPERCPACGSEQKVVTVLLAFEPDRYDPKPEPTP